MPAGYRIRRVSIPDLDDTDMARVASMFNLLRAEREPRATDLTAEELRVYWTAPGTVRFHHLILDDSDELAGYLTLYHPDDGSNPSLLGVTIGLLPAHRRMGIGSSLLAVAVDAAKEMGRTALTGEIYDTVPAAEKFAAAIGADTKLEMHYNVVRVDDLDLDLLRGWQHRGPERAPGYSVVVSEGLYPDDMMEGMARLYVILDRDSPRPEGWEPREWTAEFVRSWMANFLESVDLLTATAVEDATGAPVGMSQLGKRHSDDRNWFVTTTMVDPAHRGRSLGKWVKAVSCLTALERWPRAEWMETGNAFSNEPMLAINHAMGFRHELTLSDLELSVEQAEAYLSSRTATRS